MLTRSSLVGVLRIKRRVLESSLPLLARTTKTLVIHLRYVGRSQDFRSPWTEVEYLAIKFEIIGSSRLWPSGLSIRYYFTNSARVQLRHRVVESSCPLPFGSQRRVFSLNLLKETDLVAKSIAFSGIASLSGFSFTT